MALTIKYLRQSIIVGTIFLNCIIHVAFYSQYTNNKRQMPPTLSTQKVYTGEKIRTYRDKGFEGLKGQELYKDVSQRYTSSCQFWAVVTTIFPPSAAVRKLVKVCIVSIKCFYIFSAFHRIIIPFHCCHHYFLSRVLIPFNPFQVKQS